MSSNSPYYDPKIFLMDHDLDKELIQQTLELFEFVLGDHDLSIPQDKDLQQMFSDVINKYRDSEAISIDAIKEKIAEQGYLYLTEVFNVTDENLRILAAYLPMIQILKGTKPGLELIFTILNVGFEIKEWWEDPTNLEILSYILFVELINQPVSTSVVPRLRKFSREYVYPLLTSITLAITYKLNKTPYIGAVACTRTSLTVWQEFLWLIWSGDSAPENLWTDQYPYQDPITRRSLWQGDEGSLDELEWDPKIEGMLSDSNMWSSNTDSKDVRVWRFDEIESLPEDTDLLEWWIEKINLFGRPEESWSTEDRSIEDPIFTYWSPDTATDADGTLVRLTIVATPVTALVEINGELTYTAAVKKGEEVSYRVYEPSGDYLSQSGTIVLTEDTVLNIDLTKLIAQCTLTLSVLPGNANVIISETPITNISETGSGQEDVAKIVSKTVRRGTRLYWRVALSGYYEQTGEIVMDEDVQRAITLEKIPYYTFTINPTPSNAVVKINVQTVKSVTVMTGTKVTWSVSLSGYETKSGEEFVTADKVLNVSLTRLPTFTINPTPSNATVVINGSQTRTIRAVAGTQLTWSVSATGYTSQSGVTTMQAKDSSMNVVLQALYFTLTVTSNIAANISFVSSGGAIGQTANSITVPYGSTVTYTVDPTVDSWSANKSGSVVVTRNQTVNVNFTAVEKETSICSLSNSASYDRRSSASMSFRRIYKDSRTDLWEEGKYICTGPTKLKMSSTGRFNIVGASAVHLGSHRLLATIRSADGSTREVTVDSWSDGNLTAGSISKTSHSFTNKSLNIAAGETLLYIGATCSGNGWKSGISSSPRCSISLTLSARYTRTEYV